MVITDPEGAGPQSIVFRAYSIGRTFLEIHELEEAVVRM
jgi:hypothetical protein